jgi:hypothetical protein
MSEVMLTFAKDKGEEKKAEEEEEEEEEEEADVSTDPTLPERMLETAKNLKRVSILHNAHMWEHSSRIIKADREMQEAGKLLRAAKAEKNKVVDENNKHLEEGLDEALWVYNDQPRTEFVYVKMTIAQGLLYLPDSCRKKIKFTNATKAQRALKRLKLYHE